MHVTVRALESQPALEPAVSCEPQPHRPAYRSLMTRPIPGVAFSAVLSAMTEVSMTWERSVGERPEYRPNGPPMGLASWRRSIDQNESGEIG